MFEKWFNRKNKDKNNEDDENVKPDPVIEEKNKIIVEDEKPDKVETKKFKFSNEQVSMFSSNNEIIRKEIFNINSNFTKVIHAIDRKLSANDRYNINYGDIRILYEELINLTILKFITSSQLAKNLY